MTTSTLSERLRQLADDMQSDIDNKLGPRRDNTPKRQREAMSARIDGRHLQRVQEALRKLADARDTCTLPRMLDGLKTKSAISPLVAKQLTSNGYYHIGETDDYRDQTPIAIALRAFLWYTETPEEKAAKEAQAKRLAIEAMEQKLRFANIPGFFPTPADIVARLIYEANIEPGQLVLEPSAGKGDIAEAIREAGASVICCERNHSLHEILLEKGFTAMRCDFMDTAPEEKYEAVVMNPPFENGQDAEHVQHAFKFLKPGGRLVAITGAGIFFRTDRKAVAFREWLEDNGGTVEDLPDDAFKSGFVATGVRTKMVCVEKPAAETIEEAEFTESAIQAAERFTAEDFQSYLFAN